jgi:hypothetical protein
MRCRSTYRAGHGMVIYIYVIALLAGGLNHGKGLRGSKFRLSIIPYIIFPCLLLYIADV